MNAWWPMEVTEFGMSTAVIEEHPEKACSSIEVTEGGIAAESNPEQSINAYDPSMQYDVN